MAGVAKLHVQAIKYADLLAGMFGRQITEALKIQPYFRTEILKLRKISARLAEAGLDVSRL